MITVKKKEYYVNIKKENVARYYNMFFVNSILQYMQMRSKKAAFVNNTDFVKRRIFMHINFDAFDVV